MLTTRELIEPKKLEGLRRTPLQIARAIMREALENARKERTHRDEGATAPTASEDKPAGDEPFACKRGNGSPAYSSTFWGEDSTSENAIILPSPVRGDSPFVLRGSECRMMPRTGKSVYLSHSNKFSRGESTAHSYAHPSRVFVEALA